jgi:hypothetical protein
MPCRRFGLLDGMILISGLAVGIVTGRELFAPDLTDLSWSSWFHPFLGFVLMVGSVLMLIFRLRRPRPPIRRVANQPGFVACFAMVVFLVAMLIGQVVQDGCRGFLDRWGYAFVWGEFAFGKEDLLAWSVVIGWTLLALGRRWRPEQGWIDGLGRAIGYAWIAWGLSGFVLPLVDLLTPAPPGPMVSPL